MRNDIELFEENLRRVCYKIKKKGREILNDYDITPPQFEALIVLNNESNITIGSLSKRLYVAYSTLTDLLDRMEKNELVARVKDHEDRRVSRVCIAPKGEEVLERVMEMRIKYVETLMSSVCEADAEIIRRSFELLRKEVDQ